ncbi:rim15, signal transduction response regulator [Coemansia sp. RSA 1199]|nr:rim15, signal transduction response regulator [Coemansia sp. RSA 1199]
MSGTRGPKPQRNRSRHKRRRFGFLNLFGFSGDTYDESNDDGSSESSSRSQRQQSSSRNSSDRDHGDDSTAQPPEAPSEPVANKEASTVDANAVIELPSLGAANNRMFANTDVSAMPRPISIGLHASTEHASTSGLGSSKATARIAEHFAPVSPVRGRADSAQIRTCPIPERLRLQLKDQTHGVGDSSSPTLYSASTVTESPRMIPEPRSRRRGTIGAFGSTAADKQVSPRTDKIVIPMTRRTSSNTSTWSTATPTSSAADSVPATVTSQADSTSVPDWEPASQSSVLTKARNRGRRYSVFDISFASQQQQRPSGSLQPASPVSRRRGSSKSTLDVGAESASYGDSQGRLSGAEPGPIFGGSSNIRRRTSSRVRATSPGADMRGTYSYAQMSPTLAHTGQYELPAPLLGRRQQSRGSITTFSMRSQPDIVQPESDVATHTSTRSSSRGRRRRVVNDSSSGQSTPTGTLFSHMHRNRSSSVRSANIAEISRALEPPASARTWRLPGQALQPMQPSCDAGGAGSDDETQFLRFGTSVPDILFMPMVYRRGGHVRTVRRPDYSYERLLAVSRSTKAQRWRALGHRNTTASEHEMRRYTHDPSDNVVWSDWTDSVVSSPHTKIVQRAVETWQKILRAWRRDHTNADPAAQRRDSSVSAANNSPRPPTAVRTPSASGSGSGTCAMLNPYVVEPIYLQRGVSESGRHSLPSCDTSLMHQLTGYSQMDALLSPPDTTPAANTSEIDDSTLKQPALPHRRLSIVKGHDVGRMPATKPSAAVPPHSVDGKVSAGSSTTSMASAEPSPWILSRLDDDPSEAADVLLAFHDRLLARLSRAKNESEEELLATIQSLSEFVEEGLSYVHEDMDAEGFSSGSDAEFSDTSYGTDEEGAETPGLVMPTRTVHPVASGPPRIGPPQWANEAASTQMELKSLNRRLHDVLSRHSGTEDVLSRHAAGVDRVELPPLVETAQRGSAHSPSPMRLPRSPSIRRLAFLRAIAGEGTATPTPLPSSSRAATHTCTQDDTPCIVCTPSPSETGSESTRPRTWHHVRATTPEYFKCDAQPQDTHASLPAAVPFPDLHKRRSTQSVQSGRPSLSERSASRASMYSSGSGTSMLTTPLIAEDEFQPTPFLEAIMDLVNLIGLVLALAPADMLRPLSGSLLNFAIGCMGDDERVRGMMPTAFLIQRLDDLGHRWEQSSEEDGPAWPCRGLFFRALLAISALNRIAMWYVAVRAAYSDDAVVELDRRIEAQYIGASQDNERGLVASPEPLDIATPQSMLRDSTDLDTSQTPPLPGHRAPRWRALSDHVDSMADLDRGLNMLVEIALDGRIRYISPTSQRLLGADVDALAGQPASELFDSRDIELCRTAVAQLLGDSTRTVELRLRIQAPTMPRAVRVEAKGMLVYDRVTNTPSHVLWVLRYLAAEPDELHPCDAETSEVLVPELPMEPIMCRICDRSIPAVYFEEHSWLCAQSHRAAMDVERHNERLDSIRAQLLAWHPNCALHELDNVVHGDADALRALAQTRAEHGGAPWLHVLETARPAIQSMARMCTRAISLERSDAAPQCEWKPDSRGDFACSEAWKKVAAYTPPALPVNDECLQELAQALVQAIGDKLAAVEDLQYAIVDSALACTKWMRVEDSVIVPEAVAHPTLVRTGAKSTSDLVGLANDYQSDSIDLVNSEPPQVDTGAGVRRSQSSCSLASRATETSAMQPTDPVSAVSSTATSATTAPTHRDSVNTTPIRDTATAGSQLRISTTNLAAQSPRTRLASDELMATPTVPSIHDFDLLKPISKGAYGSVYLAKKRSTCTYYAIKILKKADMIAKNQIGNVRAERAIMMAQTGSPFVVRLLYTFQSRSNLYLVMEYLNGGDCAALLKAIGVLPEDWARQYLAEVVLGIEDLHKRNVVHRDLKPDNLLIDSEGHLKLTDFGLSKLGFLGRRVGQQPIPHILAPGDLSVSGSASSPLLVPPQQPLSSQQLDTNNVSLPPVRSDRSYRDSAMDSDMAHAEPGHIAENKRVAALRNNDSPKLSFTAARESATSTSSTSFSTSTDEASSGRSSTTQSTQGKHALGTPDYIAPESVLGLESGESVDWWALGIICYEFLFGIPPFHDETPERVFQNILAGHVDFYDAERKNMGDQDEEDGIPEISPEARDFITRLLCRDPRRRLGYNGAAEVKAHPIFRGINWDTLFDAQPAFVPQVENIEDTDYFDARGATMDQHSGSSPYGHGSEISNSSSDGENASPSKSHEEKPLTLQLSGVSFHRPKTMPVSLDDIESNARSDTGKTSHAEPFKPTRRSSGHRDDVLPKLDEGPEFGGFTFKNLHVLEEANMNELVKLRRRSTLVGARPPFNATSDVSSAPHVKRFSSFMSSSAASLGSDSPSFRASFGSHGAAQSLHHGTSLGTPLVRTATLPLLTTEFASDVSSSRASVNLGSQSAHTRALSTHSQRGSLLNPNVQTPQSARSEYEHSLDTLSFAASDAGHSDSSHLAPLPPFRKSITIGSLHGESDSTETFTDYTQSKVCLVADDNPVFCKVIEIILQRMHIECVIVRNGAEAIRSAMGRTVFRAIFMDTRMPIVDGDEATRMIKSTYNANKDTPVFAMAAYEDEAQQVLYDNVLVKPITASQIKQLLCL